MKQVHQSICIYLPIYIERQIDRQMHIDRYQDRKGKQQSKMEKESADVHGGCKAMEERKETEEIAPSFFVQVNNKTARKRKKKDNYRL